MSHPSPLIWITGASSGIGAALAQAWSRNGARLILSARREPQLGAVRDACARPEQHLIVPLDLADPASIQAAAERVADEAGAVDVLVNNGGISQRALAIDTDLEVDRRIIEVNVLGTIALTKAVLPTMLARGSGRFVVVSSLTGMFGSPLRTTYAASKHALHGFFDSLRAEVTDAGLHVTIVCPGFIRTNVSVNALTGDGTPQGVMDDAQANGMPPEDCAARIIKAVAQGKREVYIGGKEVLGVYLKRFVPALFERIIRTAKVT